MSDMSLIQEKEEASTTEYFPLSFSQQRLWFLAQISSDNSAYNVNMALRLKGSLNQNALLQAIQTIINRHEILRIITISYDGKGLQTPIKDLLVDLKFFDISNYDVERQALKVQKQLYEEANTAFDLASPPLFRFCLIKLADDNYVFSSVFHHIIIDAWSLDIFFKELTEIYNAIVENRAPLLPKLDIQYIDFASWHRDYLETETVKNQLTFWEKWLSGAPDITTLPLDKQRPEEMNYQGAVVRKSLGIPETKKLDLLAKANGVTLFTLLLTLYQVALAKISSQTTVIVGTPFLNRHYPEVENLIGFFSNTLAVRLDIDNNQTLEDLLRVNQANILDATENQDAPFEKIVDALNKKRSLSMHPIFQTLFSFKNKSTIQNNLNSIDVSPMEIEDPTSKYDLVLLAVESEKGLDLYFEYATDIFINETIEQFSSAYLMLLKAVDNLMNQKFIDIMVPLNNSQSIVQKNQTAGPQLFGVDRPIMDLIRLKALEFPNNIALSSKELQLTYKEMIEKINQFSNFLKSYVSDRGARVIIALPRGIDSILSLLAVLQNGCTYIPVDLSWPKERQQFILQDSNADIVITYHSFCQDFNSNNIKALITIDKELEAISRSSKEFSLEENDLENIAYIIYTSGSTGKPKGVLVPHKGIANLACSQAKIFKITPDSRVLQFASLSFDAVVSEWSTALSQGAALHVLSEKNGRLTGDLIETLKDQKISVITLPPSVANVLPIELSLTLKTLVLAGESGNSMLVNNWSDKVNLVNAYGPTEATVCATCHVFSKGDSPTIIGKPIHNVQVYILDEANQLISQGKTGEIVVGGLGVAKGYLNQDDLTQSKFIPDFISKKPGAYLYKTGDLAKYDEHGNVVYVGRLDSQVKLRGYRIELGEIEQVLMEPNFISEAVVLLETLKSDQKTLSAYLKLNKGMDEERAKKELFEYSKTRLPAYMVPGKWTFVSNWPINSSGKIDRKALSSQYKHDLNESEKVIIDTKPIQVVEKIEGILLDIWSKLLKRESIQRDDDFFKLGGDSIIAVQCVTRARKEGIELSVKQLFKNPILSKLAQCCHFIESSDFNINVTEETKPFSLAPLQRWFFSLNLKNMHRFNQSISLDAKHKIDGRKLERVLKLLLKTHSSLRLRFKKDHNEKWQQYYLKLEETYEYQHGICEQVFLGERPNNDLAQKNHIIEQLQSSLNIEKGPVFKAILLKGHQKDTLIMVCHHLVIDGISWRILLNDLEEAYGSIINNTSPNLSFIRHYSCWVKKIYSLAQTDMIQQEKSYWIDILNQYQNSSQAKCSAPTTCILSNSQEIVDVLTIEETKALTQEIPEKYQTQINDILITALCFAMRSWLNTKTVAFMLEGHGREQLSTDMVLDRTVGWFTSIYPVLIDFESAHDLLSEIETVKNALLKVPKKGVGFGMLNYCISDESLFSNQNNLPNICFNYLGQWSSQENDGLFKLSNEEILGNYDPNNKRIYAMDINARIFDTVFQLSISYDSAFKHSEIIQFKNNFLNRLRNIINQKDLVDRNKVFSLTDSSSCNLSSKTLHDISKEIDFPEELYPLSPMQSSMLATVIRSQALDPYVRQNLLELNGSDTNPLLLKQAWQSIIDSEPIFKTGFIWKDLVDPLQYVAKKVEIIWHELDWSKVSFAEQNEKLQVLLEEDYRNNFILNRPPLARFYLIQRREYQYILVWSMHHIIMDGWCISIIIQKFLDNYQALLNGQSIVPLPGKSYRKYIEWLQSQNLLEAESFWKNYLKDAKSAHLSCQEVKAMSAELEQGYYYLEFEQQKTEQLKKFAAQYQFTLNHIIQAAWLIW